MEYQEILSLLGSKTNEAHNYRTKTLGRNKW